MTHATFAEKKVGKEAMVSPANPTVLMKVNKGIYISSINPLLQHI